MEFQLKWFPKVASTTATMAEFLIDSEGQYKTEASIIGMKEVIFEESECEINKFWIVPLIEQVPIDHGPFGNKCINQITGS